MLKLLALDLQLFADGGASGGSGSAAGTDAGSDNATGDALLEKYGMTSDLPAGVDIPSGDKPDDGSGADLDKEFEELVKGKFKDQYGKRVEDTIKKRFAGSEGKLKAANDRVASYAPLMDLLAAKYGVTDAADVAAITKAVNDDDSFFEEAASEKNMTVEEFKAMRAIERENAELKRWREERTAQENRDRQYSVWFQQAADTQKVYPDFDLRRELQNPQFAELLQNTGITVQGAYEAVHHNEMMQAAVRQTNTRTKDDVAKSIIAGAKRPTENGVSASPAAPHVTDVSKMTADERHELIRRAARGEKIRFR